MHRTNMFINIYVYIIIAHKNYLLQCIEILFFRIKVSHFLNCWIKNIINFICKHWECHLFELPNGPTYMSTMYNIAFTFNE